METRSTMGGRALAAEKPDTDPELTMLERNGITRITSHQYRADGYLYTNLADALAQVRRGARGRAETMDRPAA